jgi:hypothetical protein
MRRIQLEPRMPPLRGAMAAGCAAALLIAPVTAALARVGQERSPRCFGAASRDPRQPCRNPRLGGMVAPTPTEARRGTNAPCDPVERVGQVLVCAFGAPATSATSTLALVGDSHAAHLRAALAGAAVARGWHGVSLTQAGCPLTRATKILREPLFSECKQWNAEVVDWLEGHPGVQTVVVSQIVSRVGVVPAPGRSKFATAVAGYVAAWKSLPASVRRVVVVRDNPKGAHGVLGCVEAAIAAGRRAAIACASRRGVALERDPAVVAAERLRSRRVATVDLSAVYCDRRCYPVIGGALVYKDRHHLTQVFSRTLAPILGRRIAAAMRPIRAPARPRASTRASGGA